MPISEKGRGIRGALAKGDEYKPSKNGVIVCFGTDDIDSILVSENQTLQLLEYAGRKNIQVRFLEHLYSDYSDMTVKEEAILTCISQSYQISLFQELQQSGGFLKT